MWYKIDDSIVEGKFYLTCFKKLGEVTQVQKMKLINNLWLTEQGDYVYYVPSHYKEV